MARTRSLIPGQPVDEDVATMSIWARYVWAFLPCHADREGRLKDSAFTLKAAILPGDQDVDMESLLAELAARKHIIRYQIDGRKFIQIRTFLKHQTPHTREQASTIPGPIAAAWAEHDLGGASTQPRSAGVSPSPSIPDPDPDQIQSGSSGARAPARSNGDAERPLTGHTLCRLFGQIRAREIGGMPWQNVRVATGAASTMAEAIEAEPGARADVEPTIVLLFKQANAGAAGPKSSDIVRDPSFAFGAWCSRWTQLREEVRGLAPRAPNPDQARRQATRAATDAAVAATEAKLKRDRNFTPMSEQERAEMHATIHGVADSKAVA